MLELLVLGALVFAGLAVFGALWAAASMVCWILFLPFKLLGLIFRGFAFLLAIPFLAIFAVLGVLVFGAGLLVFFVPALPIVLLAVAVWWLMRRRSHPAAHASS